VNVLENPNVGIMFIVPKRREVVRVSGSAQVVRDAELLQGMAVHDKLPDLALLARVREAFFHCGKSMIRSGMWEPDRWGSIEGLPTYAQALKDHGNLSDPLSDLERRMAHNETDRLYGRARVADGRSGRSRCGHTLPFLALSAHFGRRSERRSSI
jgi:hypothetical protein